MRSAGIALALFWISCAVAAAEPRRGGTLIFANTSDPPTYDCQATTTFNALQALAPHYSRLLRIDPEHYPAIQPEVASAWTISDDGLEYRFALHPDIRFHDGSPLTSLDIKATFDRIRAPPPGIVSARQTVFEDIDRIEVLDPTTVAFRLKQPNASFLLALTSPWNCLYSAAKLAQDPRWPEKHVMGSGPFRFTGHVAGSHWTGERFDGYFESGKPYLDGFRLLFMSGSATVNALQGGQIQAEFRGVSPAERDRLMAALGDRVVVQESPAICPLILFFNTRRHPFDDTRVRRALSLAIDRWKGADALSRIAFVRWVGGVLRPGFALATREADLVQQPGFGRDIGAARAEARRLLADAGAARLQFTLLSRNVPMPYTPVGIFLIDQWRRIGLTVDHRQIEVGQQKAALASGDFEVGLDSNCGDLDDPNIQLLSYVSIKLSSVDYSAHHDDLLDELYEQQRRSMESWRRAALLGRFESRLFEQSYATPIVWWHRIVVHSASLHGWTATPSYAVNQDLAGVWLSD